MSENVNDAPRKWHRELIKAEIRMRDETLTSLARKNDLQPDAVRDALRNRRPAAEAVIAKFIKVPAAELWPDRYPEIETSTSVDTQNRERTHGQNEGGV